MHGQTLEAYFLGADVLQLSMFLEIYKTFKCLHFTSFHIDVFRGLKIFSFFEVALF